MIRKARRQWFIVFLIAVLFMTVSCFAEEEKEKRYSLEDCLKLALQNSETVKTAALNVTKARYNLKQVEAGFLPTLSYNTYAKDNDSNMEYYGGVSLSQALYTGGKLKANLKQARLELDNALEDERKAKQELIYEVKAAFYKMWLAVQKLKVAQEAYDNMEKHFHDVERKYQEGTVPQFDLIQAEVNWRKLKPDVIAAKNEVSLCRSNLGLLIGIKRGEPLEINEGALAEILPQKQNIDFEKALETAYQNRPEMRQQQNDLEMAKLDVAIAQAGYRPTLTLSGSYESTGDDLDSDWDKVWALKLDLSGTLFNGFETQAKVAAAKTEVQVQKSSDQQLRDQIRLGLEQGLQTLEESIETVEANQANIGLAKESLRLVRLKLEEGMATTTDLMDAQLDLDEALNGYYEGISDYLTALANLDLILGKDLNK